ncbi:MAG: class I SAM-dependent methyltransferase [Haloferacaceae archaeon]
MPRSEPFERHAERYERWFEEHDPAYRSELDALERLVPDPGYGLEIGVGSARFAAPLGIRVGVDPAVAMLRRARERGVDAVRGVAEALPFAADAFDTVLSVTTVCFVDSIERMMREARRVLRDDGTLVLGYIDKHSPVGQRYLETKARNPFYREATFVSTERLRDALDAAGFSEFEFVQTVFRWPGDLDDPDPVRRGYGDGSFVGLSARA